MTPKLIGLLILGIPALIIGWAVLRQQRRPIFFFYLALLAIGLGYLAVTGAAEDVYKAVFGVPPVEMQLKPTQ